MKSLRSFLSLLFAAALAGSVALADHHETKKSGSEPEKAACGCAVAKDGKTCGVDKDCCCTGEKAKGKCEEKAACGDKAKCDDKSKCDDKTECDKAKCDDKKTADAEGKDCSGCKA